MIKTAAFNDFHLKKSEVHLNQLNGLKTSYISQFLMIFPAICREAALYNVSLRNSAKFIIGLDVNFGLIYD